MGVCSRLIVLPRRQMRAGAASAAAVASMPAAAIAAVDTATAVFVGGMEFWPDDIHPNTVRDGDFYIDHWSNAVWRYETDWHPGWVYLRKIRFPKTASRKVSLRDGRSHVLKSGQQPSSSRRPERCSQPRPSNPS